MATIFQAEKREKTGKGPARQLRLKGKIPAIVYGGHGEPVQITLPLKETKRELTTNPRFFSTVFELDFGEEKLKVLPREAQLHPVTDDPLHVDFLRAEQGAKVTVEVPVRFVHEDRSPGMKRGGVLNIVRRTVELLCPADAIPGELVIDLAGREIGDSIHISHVALPEGVRPTITDRDFTICSIVPPTVAQEGAGGDTPAS
ncbi:MAG: 50S ribosomal protein L25/general stress protein Ctc [Geminicoccaceae bacterium]